MKIGVHDWDIKGHGSSNAMNINLMKMTTYHQRMGNEVIYELDTANWDKYDLFYIFRDNTGSIRGEVNDFKTVSSPKVKRIGTYFTNGEWVPMEEEIEKCRPNLDIYRALIRDRLQKNNLIPDNYIRFTTTYFIRYFYPMFSWKTSLKGCENKKVFLCDHDFTANEGWREAAWEVRNYSGRTLQSVRPIRMRSISDMEFLSGQGLFSRKWRQPVFYSEFPEIYGDFYSFTKEYLKVMQGFVRNSFFFYIDSPLLHEDLLERAVKSYDIAMYAASKGIRLYPRLDKPEEKHHEYFPLMHGIERYFYFNCNYTLGEKMKKGDLKKIKERYPKMYDKMCTVRVKDLRAGLEKWNYGERE